MLEDGSYDKHATLNSIQAKFKDISSYFFATTVKKLATEAKVEMTAVSLSFVSNLQITNHLEVYREQYYKAPLPDYRPYTRKE